jgi:hypothetical protein
LIYRIFEILAEPPGDHHFPSEARRAALVGVVNIDRGPVSTWRHRCRRRAWHIGVRYPANDLDCILKFSGTGALHLTAVTTLVRGHISVPPSLLDKLDKYAVGNSR